MTEKILTVADLQTFRNEFLKEIKMLLAHQRVAHSTHREWLRSDEVRTLLTISSGTLNNLRTRGKLPFTKIGGMVYYHYEDIKKMLEAHKQNAVQSL